MKTAKEILCDLKPGVNYTSAEVGVMLSYVDDALFKTRFEAHRDLCRCNCHDKDTRESMNMAEHGNCEKCLDALLEEAEALGRGVGVLMEKARGAMEIEAQSDWITMTLNQGGDPEALEIRDRLNACAAMLRARSSDGEV